MNPNCPMNAKRHAFTIVAAVSRLHGAGYGRLRILCYVKDGISAWRHRLFASDGFNPDDAPGTFLYSLPGRGIATGKNSRAIAAKLLKEFTELMQEAQGPSDSYAVWLRSLLVQHPGAVFEMEEPEHALVNGWRVKSPFFGERPDDTFAVHFFKLLLDRRNSLSGGGLGVDGEKTVTKRAAAYDAGKISPCPADEVFALARRIAQ